MAKNPTTKLSLLRAPEEEMPLTAAALRRQLQAQATAVATLAEAWSTRAEPLTFKDFEKALRDVVFAFARVTIALFLALREEHLMASHPDRVERGGRTFRRAPAITRSLATMFGVVRYARTDLREVAQDARRGFHPLDVALGLVGDRFSWNVLAMAARLATKLSFAGLRSPSAAST